MNPCLCLFNTAVSCHRRWRVRRRSEKLRVLLLCLLGSAAVVSLFSADSGLEFEFRSNSNFNSNINININSNFNPQKRSLWSVSVPSFSGRTVDQIPIAIPIFDDAHRSEDIGGWTKHRRFFHPTKNMSSSKSSSRPDFGGLDLIEKRTSGEDAQLDPSDRKERMLFAASLHSPRILSSERVIHPEDGKRAEEYWEKLYDKDFHVHTYDMHPEELEDRDDKCWFTSWAKKYYPDCNSFHEFTLSRDYDAERAKIPGYDLPFDNFYISHGYYRDVWVVHQHFPEDIKTAVKMTRFKHDNNQRNFWNTLNDALVMERLSASPRIVDIYGHCAYSVWVEAIPHEVEEVIVKGEGMAKQEDLYKDGFESLNDYTVEEKLDMAIDMAESLADLHGFKDGVIVHDDVQLCQWLKTEDGRLKLGDFNRAEVMEWNSKKKHYCNYYNGDCYGNYRSPEEYDEAYLNEQIDVFSFGNNIYGLLTGLWVFYDTDDDPSVKKKVIGGTRAFIDPRWKERSFIESKMVDVMEQCWIEEPDKRMDIFAAAKALRDIKAEHERRKRSNVDHA